MFKCPTGSIWLYRLHRASKTPPSIQVTIKELPRKLFVIGRLVIRVPKEPEKSPRRCSHFIDTSSMRCDEVLIYCTGLGVKESSTACFTRSKISALFMPSRHGHFTNTCTVADPGEAPPLISGSEWPGLPLIWGSGYATDIYIFYMPNARGFARGIGALKIDW